MKVVKVGQKCRLQITGMTHDGCGIALLEGQKVFVDRVLLGETAEVEIIRIEKDYIAAKLLAVIKSCAQRVEPFCSYFGKCGGCSLQHITYHGQLKAKAQVVRNAFASMTGKDEIIIHETLGMTHPFNYRNKALYHVGIEGDLPIIGFYGTRSNRVVDIKECEIQNTVSCLVNNAFRQYLAESGVSIYDKKSRNGLIRHIITRVSDKTGEVMVILVINGDAVPRNCRLVELLNT